MLCRGRARWFLNLESQPAAATPGLPPRASESDSREKRCVWFPKALRVSLMQATGSNFQKLYNILTRDREADALTSIATNKTPLARQLHLVLMVKKVTL